MSDLREQLIEAVANNRYDQHTKPYRYEGAIDAVLPIIEAELQKRDRQLAAANDIYVRSEAALNKANLEVLSWKASAEQNYAEWEEANKLLEQTIEVLEAVDARLRSGLSDCPMCGTLNYGGHFGNCQGTKPLLDSLKARKP